MSGQSAIRQQRLFAACYNCRARRSRCSGEQPCQKCVTTGTAETCQFPKKERHVKVPESYIKDLQKDRRHLRSLLGRGSSDKENQDGTSPLSREESDLLNPLFEGLPGVHERASEPAFIGEASCDAFNNRLLSCLDATYTPITAGLSDYLRLDRRESPPTLHTPELPERMYVRLLLNGARRFIGNYHPLFLKVTYMREVDALYRGELIPSRLWLCKFYALMSLGEAYTNARDIGDNNRVPGTNNYTTAVDLLAEMKDCYEEPSFMLVEALTLLAWASNIFGRIRTAYHYSGIAMRLAHSLGMHRSTPTHTTLSPVERESRRRTWWVLYFFDRFSASKLGHPITVKDKDIDVEMPSMDGLTAEEQEEFLDPQNLIINIRLARIIGNILTQIYGIPKATHGGYILQVHGILKQLREWHDGLPANMRLRDRDTPRPISSLQLAYNQCIIQTTRPVLLHLFKMKFKLGPEVREDVPPRHRVSDIILALAESCVNAAQASSNIIEDLFENGKIATFGYWDAHHIFSAAMILIMSAVMNPTAVNSDHLEILLSVLRCLKRNGNIPAVDFCARLSQIQDRVSTLRGTKRVFDGEDDDRSGTLASQLGQAGPTAPHDQFQAPATINQEGQVNAGFINCHGLDFFGNPRSGNFVDNNQPQLLDALSDVGQQIELASEFGQFCFGY
ncbi:fungal-specific transcription factor domain-containing protein [Aspergillus egyptiacus]|nr:fungal-specific transcription factor domain-containing protein [Aspergillus egyptiacus]